MPVKKFKSPSEIEFYVETDGETLEITVDKKGVKIRYWGRDSGDVPVIHFLDNSFFSEIISVWKSFEMQAFAITRDPKIFSGRTILSGTRFPLCRLLAELSTGTALVEIADDYNLDYKQCQRALLELAKHYEEQ